MTKQQAEFNLPYAARGVVMAADRFARLQAAKADGDRLRAAAYEWRARRQLLERLQVISNG